MQSKRRQRRRDKVRFVLEENVKFRKRLIQTKRKVRAWKKLRCETKPIELFELRDKHTADPTSVTPEDWDRVTNESKWKVKFLFGRMFPRETWPSGVPYLNLIALRQYRLGQQKKRSNARKPGNHMQGKMDKQILYLSQVGNRQAPIGSCGVLPESNTVPDHQRAQWLRMVQFEQEQARRDAEIKKLEHFLAQWALVRVLLDRSYIDLRSVTLKQWVEATEGTDIPRVSRSVAQHMEFARMLEEGEIGRDLARKNLLLAFEAIRKR